jgi:hypothetical protein
MNQSKGEVFAHDSLVRRTLTWITPCKRSAARGHVTSYCNMLSPPLSTNPGRRKTGDSTAVKSCYLDIKKQVITIGHL